MPARIGHVLHCHDGHAGIENGPSFVDREVWCPPFLVVLAAGIVPADIPNAKPKSPGKIPLGLGRIDFGVQVKSDDSLRSTGNSTGQSHERLLVLAVEVTPKFPPG